MQDMALKALLDVVPETSPDLSTDLLIAIYTIEKTHQFDENRNVLTKIQTLIDQVNNITLEGVE